nr:YitT family protein [uncultured Prevotella sp.]
MSPTVVSQIKPGVRPARRGGWKDILFITIAMIMGSVGLGVFLLPHHITMGGIGGISSILYWGLGLSPSISYLLLNICLLTVALKVLGWHFCLKTIYAVAVFSVSLFCVQHFMHGYVLLQNQPFMDTVVGAFFMGSSSGLSLSCNASTGGSDTIAAMINKYYDISLGHIIFCCDIVIVTSSYLVLRDWNQVIYGYVFLFITSMFVDQVVNTRRRSVQFVIITDQFEELGEAINNEVPRGCTLIDGKGFYSGKKVKMLFVIARQGESSKIFRLIDEIDPHAFVSQSAVVGVYGLGFEPFKTRIKSKK